ncbi:zinc finger protein [Nephila pilipes]|uniref:Zinc finger protein n=1 Tax=Nephila pilipes TaxID=299642 RepID=A0A8X6QV48_NEPPI|nr:zinc finger protein [Nephila pilipes]
MDTLSTKKNNDPDTAAKSGVLQQRRGAGAFAGALRLRYVRAGVCATAAAGVPRWRYARRRVPRGVCLKMAAGCLRVRYWRGGYQPLDLVHSNTDGIKYIHPLEALRSNQRVPCHQNGGILTGTCKKNRGRTIMPCGSAKESNHQDKNGENGHCAFQDLDHSILQHPFNLGVTNVKQILKCMQNGSKEIKDIILNECNIIYECKICANLFRSLANFLYHKRCYCKKHLCEDMLLFDNFEEETQSVIVQPEPPDKDVSKTLAADSSLPQMMDCTVKLQKTDLVHDKTVQVANSSKVSTEDLSVTREKNLRNKNNKTKDFTEESIDGKKIVKGNKNESPMISRRTREKNSINATKRALKDANDSDAPKKTSKTVNRVSTTVKVSNESVSKSIKTFVETESIETVEEINKSEKDVTVPIIYSEKNVKKSDNEEAVKCFSTERESNKIDNDEAPKETDCSKSIFSKQLKKIIITEPKPLDGKSNNVFENIQTSMKSNKIGFTKITNATGKKLQCFPKIIFKTIDGNPHAVFQTTENKSPESITLKSKFENTAGSNKSENEKLIIVLKKEHTTPSTTESKTTAKTIRTCKSQSEFHLTRRKRLMARNDCNVQELKCLTCNTQFTSLKTLYFHMLSIHSKKRLYYPCPFCKTLFVQMYGVTRHLVSIHNKTKEQVNKLRDAIKKKSIWKKLDDATLAKEEISSEKKMEDIFLKNDPQLEIKPESSVSTNNVTESSALKTIIKLNKNDTLHRCSKCGRVFGRKSSQVSHEKFCIMNAIKVETVDLTNSGPISPPPNVSFLSFSPKQANPDSNFHKRIQTIQHPPSDIKINARPKRGAEKRMHKDFVNSQTLKWRSANRVDTNSKTAQPIKKSSAKNLEKKVLNIINIENLLCTKCDKVFSSFSNLRRHAAIHVGWTRFKCKHCDYQAYNKSQCWAHVQKAHGITENDLEKSIVNLNCTPGGKKAASNSFDIQVGKRSDVKVRQIPKTNGIPKVKITRKKIANNYSKLNTDKKQTSISKKGNSDKKDENKRMRSQSLDMKKEITLLKKDKGQNMESKKEMNETKKEKNQTSECKKAIIETRKEKILNPDSKKSNNDEIKKEKNQCLESNEVSDAIKEKIPTPENKIDPQDVKKEKNHSVGPIFKYSVSDYKKDASNYKSVTTNNPTTIILSKKFSVPTVQSFMTVSSESLSSVSSPTKTFPLRSSPRKIEVKALEENKLTSLVTRSTAYSKGGPLQIKMSIRSNSEEDLKKSVSQSPEKTYAKKDRLISEWFPKKDLNSNNVRRESAPLIIGLVPAANAGMNAGNKSPIISFERNNS